MVPVPPSDPPGGALVLELVDGPERGAADLVVTAKQPVGGRQDLTAGIAAQGGQPHRGAVEDQGGVAGRLQQVQDQEHGQVEDMGDRAGCFQPDGGASGPKPLQPDQQGREADQAKDPRGGVETAGQVALGHAAYQEDPDDDAGGGPDGTDPAL